MTRPQALGRFCAGFNCSELRQKGSGYCEQHEVLATKCWLIGCTNERYVHSNTGKKARGCCLTHSQHINLALTQKITCVKLALDGKIICGGEPIPTCVECQNKDKGDARPWLHSHCVTGFDCVCDMNNLCTCNK